MQVHIKVPIAQARGIVLSTHGPPWLEAEKQGSAWPVSMAVQLIGQQQWQGLSLGSRVEVLGYLQLAPAPTRTALKPLAALQIVVSPERVS